MRGVNDARNTQTPLAPTIFSPDVVGDFATLVRRAARREEFPTWVAAWLADYTSTATISGYRRDFATWLRYCHEHRLDPARPDWRWGSFYAAILAAATYPQDHRSPRKAGRPKYSAATRARMLAAVSSFYTFTTTRSLTKLNPMDHLRRPEVHEQPRRVLTDTEVDRLIEVAASAYGISMHGRDNFGAPYRTVLATAVSLMADLGWRRATAVGARIEDLEVRGGFHAITTIVKGGKPHLDVLSDRTMTWIDKHHAERGNPESGPLLARPDGTALRLNYLSETLRHLARKAGLPTPEQVSPHTLRRTMITTGREAGIPIDDLARGVGHADVKTTMRYDQHAAALERHPVVQRGQATRAAQADLTASPEAS